jgi:hypothetical protein
MQQHNLPFAETTPPQETPSGGAGFGWLLAAAVLTVVLWQLPFGNYLLYPFTLLATWFHEMGHGLAAVLLGGNFHHLALHPDGSGVAVHSGSLGRVGEALVSAGGPMGPALAGAFFIIAGRSPGKAHYLLYALGGILILSALIWVRSWFGFAVVLALGAAIVLIAHKAAPWTQRFTLQFLGVQACLSTWGQIGYLFTESVEIDGQFMYSDTAQIARALFFPYWFWGGAIIGVTAILLLFSLWWAYRR